MGRAKVVWVGALVVAMLVGCGGSDAVVARETNGAETPAGSAAPEASVAAPPPVESGGVITVRPTTPNASAGPGSSGAAASPVPSDHQTVDPRSSAEDPDGSVAGSAQLPAQGQVRMVTPRPGMADVHPTAWERAEIVSERVVRIYFYAGVEPCSVLDRVDVRASGGTIRITLYSGSDPASPDAMCIQTAELKSVDVRLESAIADRKIVDGAAN